MTQRGVIYVTKIQNYVPDSRVAYGTPYSASFIYARGKKKKIIHNARIVTCADEKKRKLISLLTNDVDLIPYEIIVIYCQRCEIELLFKQLIQNFP